MNSSYAIWKYPIEVTDYQEIQMPRGAKILCVQIQHGVPVIWAEVHTGMPKVMRLFSIYGTGHPLPTNDEKYVGTFQTQGGDLVWHLYDAGEIRS